MPGFNEITPTQLIRLIGTPDAPHIVDVRIAEDIAENPSSLPCAVFCTAQDVGRLAKELPVGRIVIVCHKGKKLSHGAAALLRLQGRVAEVLEGGMQAWCSLNMTSIPLKVLPNNRPSVWVTRHRPKIDRLACPWLIRRFVDPDARFLFVPAAEVSAVAERFEATAFNVPAAAFSHRGEACSFDAFLDHFALRTEALDTLAQVIRGADTDRHDFAPQCAGLLAISVGMSRMYKDDLAQLSAAIPVYDALYRWARDGQNEGHDWVEGPGQ